MRFYSSNGLPDSGHDFFEICFCACLHQAKFICPGKQMTDRGAAQQSLAGYAACIQAVSSHFLLLYQRDPGLDQGSDIRSDEPR